MVLRFLTIGADHFKGGGSEIVEHGPALALKVVEPIEDFGSRIDLFLEEHSGASQRTLDAIDAVLAARAGV